MTLSNVDVDYTGQESDYSTKHLIHEYDVTGRCPDGTSINVNLTIEVSGSELADWMDKLDKAWDKGESGQDVSDGVTDHTAAQARDKALSQMHSECPPCPPFKGV